MIYQKLKRTHTHGYLNYIPKLKKVFPEMKHLDSEELCERFRKLNLDFYYKEETTTPIWIRFTLPFAILFWIILLASIPIHFLMTGRWKYKIKGHEWVVNWFSALGM